MESTISIVKKIKVLVQQKAPGAEVFLYGSRARGKARHDSDWDVLILLNNDKISNEEEKNITDPLYDLEFEIGEVISPMIYSKKEWETKYKVTSFYSHVMKEAKLV